MISYKRLEEQMKKINFYHKGWGHSEVDELCNIMMPEEEIEECVNGYYDAGFALMVATKDRVLLVDKKPLGYLTVEDMRFDMINELDLHHRFMGAQVRISAGNKTLHFTSLNQARLRRLLNYVQARMTQIKRDASEHQNAQKQHLEEMNEQLRLYLMAFHKQQFVDRAQQIEGTALGPRQIASSVPPEAELVPVSSSSTPSTPFEQAAMAAFDAHATDMGQVAPEPPTTPVARAGANPSSVSQIVGAVPRYSQAALKQAENIVTTPQQIGLAAARRVVPIISAYTRLPLMSQRRRFGPDRGVTPDAA